MSGASAEREARFHAQCRFVTVSVPASQTWRRSNIMTKRMAYVKGNRNRKQPREKEKKTWKTKKDLEQRDERVDEEEGERGTGRNAVLPYRTDSVELGRANAGCLQLAQPSKLVDAMCGRHCARARLLLLPGKKKGADAGRAERSDRDKPSRRAAASAATLDQTPQRARESGLTVAHSEKETRSKIRINSLCRLNARKRSGKWTKKDHSGKEGR